VFRSNPDLMRRTRPGDFLPNPDSMRRTRDPRLKPRFDAQDTARGFRLKPRFDAQDKTRCGIPTVGGGHLHGADQAGDLRGGSGGGVPANFGGAGAHPPRGD
jgi:hypothetical protein